METITTDMSVTKYFRAVRLTAIWKHGLAVSHKKLANGSLKAFNPSYTRGGGGGVSRLPKVFPSYLWMDISFENEILATLTSIMTG